MRDSLIFVKIKSVFLVTDKEIKVTADTFTVKVGTDGGIAYSFKSFIRNWGEVGCKFGSNRAFAARRAESRCGNTFAACLAEQCNGGIF